ncbi:hypothetical protein SUGI_0507540 [Cryptomeria japonica]|nr:hypothetical protein SUGI_0507540 [Cryptomeria japonica]
MTLSSRFVPTQASYAHKEHITNAGTTNSSGFVPIDGAKSKYGRRTNAGTTKSSGFMQTDENKPTGGRCQHVTNTEKKKTDFWKLIGRKVLHFGGQKPQLKTYRLNYLI